MFNLEERGRRRRREEEEKEKQKTKDDLIEYGSGRENCPFSSLLKF